MENIIEKILGSRKTSSEQKNYFSLVISKLPNTNEKVKFLLSLIEKTFPGLSDDQTYEESFTIFEFAINNLKVLNALNFESFLFLTNFTNQLECWVVVLQALLEKNTNEKQKDISQIKAFFARRLSKVSDLWYTNYLDDFFESKQSKSLSFNNQNQAKIYDYPSLSLLNTGTLIKKIAVMSEFFCNNFHLLPISIDFREILMKWILSLDMKSHSGLASKLIDSLMILCEYSATSLLSSFKNGFKFLQFSYEESDKFKPIFPYFAFLEKLEKSQIQHLTHYSLMGILWLNDSWFSCLKNLTKLGLTENVSEIFLSVSNNLLSQKNFDVLLKAFDNLISPLFSNLLFDKLKLGTIKVLELYIIGAPNNSSTIERIIQKIIALFQKLSDPDITQKLVKICDCIIKKYENVLENQTFLAFLESVKASLNLKNDPIAIQNLINSMEWLNFSKSQNDRKFRGLINLGNTCYMNSFLQCLYMTPRFRNSLLKFKFELDSNPAGQTQGISLEKLKKFAPAYQLQRLFALLFQSKRLGVNPNFFRNVLPDFFKMSYMQQDASEFAKIYLDSFELAIKDTKNEDFLKKVFCGEIIHEVCCQKCFSKTENKEKFIDLHVNFDLNKEKENNGENDLLTLNDMLEKEFSAEEMKEQEKYFCNNCNDYIPLAIKQAFLVSLPNYLILTMNRFWFDFKMQKRNKIMKFVDIPMSIDLKKFYKGGNSESTYELYAILIHKGTSTEFGHYYTFAKDNQSESKTWMMFNDSNITNMNSETEMLEFIKSSKDETPYILFYENLEERKRRESEKEIIVLDNLLKKLIEQDNAQFIKEEQMNTFSQSLMKKQIENNNNLMNRLPNFFDFSSKKDDEDDEDQQQGNNFASGNHYIF